MSARSLLIEPFNGGSHKQLIDLITTVIGDHALFTLPAKKWPWRARTSALYFSQVIPESPDYRVLFCSSVLNLTELVALRPDLASLKKVIYFHENQLIYPVRKQQDRDFQFGYNQITSCLVADVVVFNSEFNLNSFLSSIGSFLKLVPDHRPKGLVEKIQPKCMVLHFPIHLPPFVASPADGTANCSTNKTKACKSSEVLLRDISLVDENLIHKVSSQSEINVWDKEAELNNLENKTSQTETSCFVKMKSNISPKISLPISERNIPNEVSGMTSRKPLHIVWPHRWEHDKDPDSFFTVLYQLQSEGVKFIVSVIGESYKQIPEIFQTAAERLRPHISAWGYQESKADYYSVLREADVAVSTAVHEFFGVAMLEAAHLNCYILCPNRLVYPEIFPAECLYNTQQQLFKRLREFCRRPHLAHSSNIKAKIKLERFTWETLCPQYMGLFQTGVT